MTKKTTENKICVYAICKNESKFVDRWAKSMLEADSVVVLDTGSSDDTVEKLMSYGIKVEQKIISPWRFDVARNESLKLVPEDCNILVTTDLDEFFEPGWANVLRDNWIEGVHNMVSYYKYNIFQGVDGYYNTIHSRGYKWRFPVHECLYNEKEEYNILYLEDKIKLHHEQDFSKPRNSYFDLLKLRVQENPNDYLGLTFYISECFYRNLYKEAIETGNKILSFDYVDENSKWYTYKCMALSYSSIGDYEKAESAFLNMINADEHNITGYMIYAEFIDSVQHDIKKAINILKIGLKKSVYTPSWSYNKEDYNKVYDNLAVYSFYNGEKLKSLAYAYKAYSLNTEDPRLKSNLELILNNMEPEDFIK